MNKQEFEEAKKTFDIKYWEKNYKPQYELRNNFVKEFSPNKIATLPIDDFIEGKGNPNSFCNQLERRLDLLGRITNSTVHKFGVYYDKYNKKYVCTKRFSPTGNYKEAYKNIIESILSLLKAGKNKDLEAIVANPITTMFKGKILSTYYPEDYLNIFSGDHINHYLIKLDLDTKELMTKDPVYKRQALLDFKNSDKDMKNWSVNMFATFLWSQYPKAPAKDSETDISQKETRTPTPDNIEFVEMERGDNVEHGKDGRNPDTKKRDYETESRRAKELGDRGEYLVVQAEIKRLAKELSITETKAKKKVIRKSLESDSYGYDILSVNSDGSPRYIEVKATTRKCGDMEFYYTDNELDTAKEYGKDYYLYVVYEINTTTPKIWVLKNPFIGDDSLKLEPIKYKVALHARRAK